MSTVAIIGAGIARMLAFGVVHETFSSSQEVTTTALARILYPTYEKGTKLHSNPLDPSDRSPVAGRGAIETQPGFIIRSESLPTLSTTRRVCNVALLALTGALVGGALATATLIPSHLLALGTPAAPFLLVAAAVLIIGTALCGAYFGAMHDPSVKEAMESLGKAKPATPERPSIPDIDIRPYVDGNPVDYAALY